MGDFIHNNKFATGVLGIKERRALKILVEMCEKWFLRRIETPSNRKKRAKQPKEMELTNRKKQCQTTEKVLNKINFGVYYILR